MRKVHSSEVGADDKLSAACEAFWAWSVAFYKQPDVARTLIALQDDVGANVNVVLWCLWRSTDPLAPKEIELARSRLAAFNEAVTSKLRTARRALKTLPDASGALWAQKLRDDAAALRESVLELELRAEQIEQALLPHAIVDARKKCCKNYAYRNLQTYLGFSEASSSATHARFLAEEAATFKGEKTE